MYHMTPTPRRNHPAVPAARAAVAAFRAALFVAALVAAAGYADRAAVGGPGDTYRTVRDLDNRFTIAVPAAWKVTTSRGDPALSAISSSTDAGLPASLVVIVRDLPMAISPETCVYEAQFVMRRAIQRYASVSAGPDHLGSLPAWSHAYVWTAKTGEERRSVQVCVTVGRRAILTIGTTANRPARLRDDMPVLTQSIQSLHPFAIPSDQELPRGGQ